MEDRCVRSFSVMGVTIGTTSDGGNGSVTTVGVHSISILTSCFILMANSSDARIGTLTSRVRFGLNRTNRGPRRVRNERSN